MLGRLGWVLGGFRWVSERWGSDGCWRGLDGFKGGVSAGSIMGMGRCDGCWEVVVGRSG